MEQKTQSDKRANVLLVDDEPANLMAVQAALEGLGQNLLTASNGPEALKYLLDKDFALVVLDVRIPGMDGFETARLIREREKTKHIPIIFLTAASLGQTDVFRGYSVGAADYMVKPFVPEILSAKVEVFVNLFNMRASLERHLERYRDLYENAPTANFSSSATDGSILQCNAAALQLLGYDRQAMMRLKVLDLYADTPHGIPKAQRLLERSKKRRMVHNAELQMKRKEGSLFWASLSLQPICDSEGDVVETRSMAIDITDHKRAEKYRDTLLHDAAQRARELDCLYAVSTLAARSDKSLNELFQQTANLIPSAIQHPDATCARVVFRETEFATEPFRDTQQKISANIIVSGENAGAVEVCRLEERSHSTNGSFPPQARELITNLARQLGVIAERRRAEEALQESESRYRRLFETAKDGILILEADTGQILDVNPFLIEMLGYSREELLRKKLWEIAGFKASPACEAVFVELKNRAYVRHEDLPLETADGQRVKVEFVGNMYRVGQQKLIHCNIRDITERKRAEQALRKSGDTYISLVESLPQKIFLKSVNSVYVSCNENYARDLKIRPDEIAGKTDYDFYSRTLADKYVADDKRIMESKKAEDLEERWVKDGRETWVHTIKTPLEDAQGNVTGLLGIFRDITEHKSLEEQFRQAQKMEAVGRLAGGVAHDFNNLLTVIGGNAELAATTPHLPENAQRHLAEIVQATGRAANLARQLLAFSRRQPLESRVVNINDILLTMENMLRRLIGEDIELLTLPSEGLWQVRVDVGQMEQVIANLAVNARDAMAQGGRLSLETANAHLDEEYARLHPEVAAGDYVMLAVSDNGHGMTEKVKAHAFEPFFTTKGRDKGTGLGLATCYGMVKQSGGHICIYSEPRLGTTVRIYLPRVARGPGVLPAREDTEDLPQRGSETILLVEDDAAVRALASHILRNQGYTILEAANGEEALRVIHKEAARTIHLLLTDVIMPQMGGKDLAERVNAIRPAIKVLFTSGYTDNAFIREGVLEPGIVLLQKPFTNNALARRVRQALDS